MHPALEVVEDFHAALTAWFSGTGARDAVWARLASRCPPTLVLIYPSGQRLGGAAFLASIEDRFGSAPGFVARVASSELVHASEAVAVVAYVEAQTGAKRSAPENRRAALAVLERSSGGWVWRFIQETDLG